MSHNSHSRLDRFLGLLTTLVVVGAITLMGKILLFPDHSQTLFRNAALAYESQEFQTADELSDELLNLLPDDSAALLLRARVLARRNKDDTAMPLFRRLTRMDEPYATDAHLGLADHFYHGSNFPTAEKHYRRYLKNRPDDLKANKNLAFLLSFQGRTWEAIPFSEKRVALGDFNARELIMIGLAGSFWVEDKNISFLIADRHPKQMINYFGQVKQAYLNNHIDEELELLDRIIADSPKQIEPLALLGGYLLDTNQTQRFLGWHDQLPPAANSHPDIWYLRGRWEKDQDNFKQAAGCFLRALSCSLNHNKSLFQLSQVASKCSTNPLPESFGQEVKASSDINYLIAGMTDNVNESKVHKLTNALEILGRYQEAAAWCDLMCRFGNDVDWATAEKLRYVSLARNTTTSPEQRYVTKTSTALNIPMANIPFQLSRRQASPSHRTRDFDLPSRVQFENSAIEAGLEFQYFNGITESIGLQHILQATGGAAVVIDYDLDDWPDLYFCQSGEWPVEEEHNPYTDRLYRNLGNGQFRDVTELAGLGDRLYSQGATSGDVDNDGDPDLIVTNVGRNRFYLNQGDGTFLEASNLFPDSFTNETWSMSAALVDLNHDGLLDLYVVNYLLLHQVMENVCKANGQPRGCDPTMFDAEQDRVYLNNGQGGWQDITQSAGFEVPDGKGLGVVAADFDSDGQTEIFVSNDTIANFYFDHEILAPSQTLHYENIGVLSGTALNEQGSAQASMGIASGDVDADGRLDLFITNFYADSNTLYLQKSPSAFRERTRQWNMRDSSFYQLGFGTQFLDADLDGDLDLLVANGHIDLTFATGEPDVMPPQFLENKTGMFQEQPAAQVGDYFAGKYFGRSLSVLDWNKDGLQDAVITHLDHSVALLTNRSERVGTPLSLHLIGTQSNRDAIGARIRVQQKETVQHFFLTGGDGYLSCNERRVYVGLPQKGKVEISINWPSGITQTSTHSAEVGELTIVEKTSRQ